MKLGSLSMKEKLSTRRKAAATFDNPTLLLREGSRIVKQTFTQCKENVPVFSDDELPCSER